MQSCMMSFQSSPVILLKSTTSASDPVRKLTCLKEEMSRCGREGLSVPSSAVGKELPSLAMSTGETLSTSAHTETMDADPDYKSLLVRLERDHRIKINEFLGEHWTYSCIQH
ncbi:hypothetical protein COOONC_00908 [Cooperia oncophora]